MSRIAFPHWPATNPPAALSNALTGVYGLTGLRLRLLQATMREVYHITTHEGDFVLICYHAGADKDAVTAEWEFVEHLAAMNINVAPPIRQCGSELVLTWDAPEGERCAVLCTYVAGQHLRQRFSLAAVHRYGIEIARLHQGADSLAGHLKRPAIDCTAELDRFTAAIESVWPDNPQLKRVLAIASAAIKSRVGQLEQRSPAFGLIHGDVIRTNLQVADDGKATVLDFDLCGYGWRAYDIASFFQAVDGTAHEADARDSFLAGYQDVRRLTSAEHDALPAFEAWRHIFALGVPALHPACRDEHFLNPAHLSDAIKRLEKA